MNYLLRTGIILFLMTFPFVKTSFAGILIKDYQETVRKRVELEDKRKELEKHLDALSSQKRSMTIIFNKCLSQKNKDYREKKLSEASYASASLEKQRVQMAGIRKKIDSIRRNMEEKRIAIEMNHAKKGHGTQYETDFRQYMDELEKEYYNVLEQELFPGYKSYINNIDKNINFLKDTAGNCMKRD